MPEPGHSERPPGGEGTEHAGHARPLLPGLVLPATVDTVPDGARVTVIVRGELDLDSGERLAPDLLRALSGSTDGIDLQLSEVTFCDCSGINLMLGLRRLALRHGKTVRVAASSPAVDRLFDLTAIRDLFEPSQSSGLETGHAPDDEPDDEPGDEVGHDDERGAPAAPQPGATAAPTPPPALPPLDLSGDSGAWNRGP